MEEIIRRRCRLKDYDFVIGLIRESLFPLVSAYFKPDEEMYKQRFENDYKERTILFLDKKPIGFYQLRQNNQNLEVKGLFLVKDFRGKGIGYKLMKEFEKNKTKSYQFRCLG